MTNFESSRLKTGRFVPYIHFVLSIQLLPIKSSSMCVCVCVGGQERAHTVQDILRARLYNAPKLIHQADMFTDAQKRSKGF